MTDFEEEALSMLNTNLSNCQVMALTLTHTNSNASSFGPEDPEVVLYLNALYKLNGDITSATVSVALADPNAINVFTPF
jgi:hypothetical protein|tara:strand:+ start:204 stop:440 length:237 start_codon:yes stop_codon:yes gene_type:complete